MEDILEKGWINFNSYINATLGFSFERIWTSFPPKHAYNVFLLCPMICDMIAIQCDTCMS